MCRMERGDLRPLNHRKEKHPEKEGYIDESAADANSEFEARYVKRVRIELMTNMREEVIREERGLRRSAVI